MRTILIIDDEPGIRAVLSDVLRDEGYTVHSAEDGPTGLGLLKTEPVDLVFLDVWMPIMGGIDVLKAVKEEFPDIAVVIISGHANIEMAVKALKIGAFDLLEKPLSIERVLTVARNAFAFDELKRENRRLRNAFLVNDEMLGETEGMRHIREVIDQAAAGDARVLITGENGTGKELVAREIHLRSKRAGGPFVEVNCAAIPDTLIESELFGHEKGAFTGAVTRRRGRFEAAHRGTLFLDEIADLSLNAQAKILRAIQELRFERVGGEESLTVDVRVIAATNMDLEAGIRAGRFREDLFYRLNVVPITVPALRERTADIPLLVTYFFAKFQTAKPVIAEDGLAALIEYPWPGNIRELKNFVERVSVMTDNEPVTAAVVRHFLGSAGAGDSGPSETSVLLDEFDTMGLNAAKEAFERQLIVRRLERNEWNISKTAQALGVYPSNIHAKVKKYRIEIPK